jgi:hypothetical protein
MLDYPLGYAELHTELRILNETVQDDLTNKWFYYYPQAKFHLVANIGEQWGKAYAKFTAIRHDIYNAIDCYATGHPTACVFHLMRTMEFGVQCLGRRLGVSLTAKRRKNFTTCRGTKYSTGSTPRLLG